MNPVSTLPSRTSGPSPLRLSMTGLAGGSGFLCSSGLDCVPTSLAVLLEPLFDRFLRDDGRTQRMAM